MKYFLPVTNLGFILHLLLALWYTLMTHGIFVGERDFVIFSLIMFMFTVIPTIAVILAELCVADNERTICEEVQWRKR